MTSIDEWEWDELPMRIVERDYEQYMQDCYEAAMGEIDLEWETLSGYDFCGCDTCLTRETLSFLMPRLLDLYRAGSVRFVPTQHGDKEQADDVQDVSDGG